MLSKVLSRADGRRAQVVAFPHVFAETQGVVEKAGENAPPEEPSDSARLQEKLHQLEAQAANDCREAFEGGLRQGEQKARAELQPVMERLNGSIAEITAMRGDLRRRAERDVVQLALLIAKRVLHRQLTVDEAALTAIARVAFERLARSESYRVTVHPQFAAAITAALPGRDAGRVQIESDPGCALGTLVIHSAEGTMDASVDAQLEEISRGLTDRLAHQ